jgi:hypothetical protein
MTRGAVALVLGSGGLGPLLLAERADLLSTRNSRFWTRKRKYFIDALAAQEGEPIYFVMFSGISGCAGGSQNAIASAELKPTGALMP